RYAANKSFLLSGGNTGKQWTQLQRIMTTAVADGADLASVNRAILATMQQGAAAGGVFGGTGVAGIFNRMLSSGAAGAKTGTLQAGYTAALSNTLSNPGGSIMSAMPLYSYIKSHGGAHATAKSLLGRYYSSFTKSGQGREIIAALNNAQGSPYLQIQMLGLALQGNKDFASSIYSGYYNPLGPGRRELALSSATGASTGATSAIYGGGTGNGLNNPGNIMLPGTNTLASYNSKGAGLLAMRNLLLRYQNKYKLNTVKGIVGRWDAASDPNHAAYVKNVTKWMKEQGYSGKLNLNDPHVMSALMSDMIRQEGTGNMSPSQISYSLKHMSGSASPTNIALAQAGNVNKVNAAAADTQAAKQIADTLGKAIQHYAGTLFHVQHAAMEVTNATISVAAADFRNLGSYSDMPGSAASFGISPHKPLKNP
ncbi:MAG: hypothetical protein KGI54_18575, partial [Pseudomonadota bacterium]|nr:hypothetical protein [Pseudomonadota bacterium]